MEPQTSDTRPHGSRSTYQGGCRCTPCRAANAAYEAIYRAAKLRRQLMPGAIVRAPDAARQLRLLVTEYESRAALARRLGFKDRHLQFDTASLTLRNARKIRRLYETDILAGL